MGGARRTISRLAAVAAAGCLAGAAPALAAPPKRLADLNPAPMASSSPGDFAKAGKFVYFGAHESGLDTELWRTNGRAAGTRLVKRIHPGPDGSRPHGFARLGKRVLFAADDGEHGLELWRTDGTKRGTKLVRDINPGPDNSLFGAPFNPVKLGKRLIFAAQSSAGGFNLWRTDGTKRGTRRIARAGVDADEPMARLGGYVYFTGRDNRGYELWRTDGTKRGTKRVMDINQGQADGAPRSLTRVGKLVIFTADDGEHGREIWRTRGTRATTRMVRDVVPGPDPFSPYQFTRFGDQVFMQGDDGAHGAEPWATDGTKKGTRLLRDINPAGSAMAYYSGPTRFGKRVVFTAAATPGDDELWVTNGKPEGTRTFELNPTGPSLPHAFASVGRTLYFTADDGTSGDEPWIWRP